MGKIEWKYFSTKDVVYNQDGSLPGTCHEKLYSTMLVRLEKLKEQEFFKREYLALL